MIPIYSKNWSGNEDAFREIAELVRKKTVHSSLHRRQHRQFLFEQRSATHRNQWCEQFSAVGQRVWHSIALVSPTKTLNKDVAPIGDDIEPSEALRENVEMRNDEHEEPFKNESEESHDSRQIRA